MNRDIFTEDHEAFRAVARAFVEREVAPFYNEWDDEGLIPRELWTKAGEAGLLGFMMPEEYGGSGLTDFRYYAVLDEELIRAGAAGVGFPVHVDIVAPYLTSLATPEQQQRWFPGFASGELITAIAMTEPSAGSDLKAIRTTAVRDGDDFIVNGSKTFISNGFVADLIIVAVKTDPSAGARGLTLLVLERGIEGLNRGRPLRKLGLRAQDTSELYFEDVRVPAANVLGEVGKGFSYLLDKLAQERLGVAVRAQAATRRLIDLTLPYIKQREAFGQPIGSFQNSRFTMAELETEYQITQAFVDKCILANDDGTLTAVDAAMVKWWSTELNNKAADRCLQLHGGYGYMWEHPVARAYADSRIQTIAGGSTEIMKEIIGRSLGL